MPFDLEFDDDLAQRRLQGLEQRCQQIQQALEALRQRYTRLRQSPQAGPAERLQALLQFEQAQRRLVEVQFDLEQAAARAATPRLPASADWRDLWH
jgi:FtsZ-binding cell division protein ZapB